MEIEIKIIVTTRMEDPELIDKILGRIYTLDAVTDVKLAEEPEEKE